MVPALLIDCATGEQIESQVAIEPEEIRPSPYEDAHLALIDAGISPSEAAIAVAALAFAQGADSEAVKTILGG